MYPSWPIKKTWGQNYKKKKEIDIKNFVPNFLPILNLKLNYMRVVLT